MSESVRIQIPKAFKELFTEDARFKLYHGGRGGAKSYNFALATLLKVRSGEVGRVLCTREIQNSIKDSVLKLLSDHIDKYGMTDFRVFRDGIRHQNGADFIFKGLRSNSQEIKSTEGVDLCWVEEAQNITKDSLSLLVPTIRNEKSEIWFSFNRRAENDPVYEMFCRNQRPDTIVRHVNYDSNPFLTEVLRKDMEYDKANDYEYYLHVWEGMPLSQDTRSVIPRKTVADAMGREVDCIGDTIIGCDVARYGDDKTVAYKRIGNKVVDVWERTKQSITDTAYMLMDLADRDNDVIIRVDDTGLGGGVTDILRDAGYSVQGVNFGEKAEEESKYPNRASEMWFNLSDRLKTASIPRDDSLLDELSTRIYKHDDKGRRRLESKDDFKKRLGRSPDHADALALCFYDSVVEVSDEWYTVEQESIFA